MMIFLILSIIDSCDFDDPTICTWVNDRVSDYFDWTDGSAGTPSQGTGPSVDHTYGTATGELLVVSGFLKFLISSSKFHTSYLKFLMSCLKFLTSSL